MPESPILDQPPFADAVARWSAAHPVIAHDGGPSGKTLSLWVRLQGTETLPLGEIVGWRGTGDRWTVRVCCALVSAKRMLVATLATEARDQPLTLMVPLSVLGSVTDHALVLRYAGHRLELWIDGVLADEEWPLGALRAAVGPMQVGGELRDHVLQVAWWDRVLSEEEISLLPGGRGGRAEREARILGPDLPFGQFWLPRGYNVHVGDCMPFFHAGRFHLFYLLDRRNHASMWGVGGHQWAHVSSTDLVTWAHHPLALRITAECAGSICTGSVFFHAGVFHAFHSVRRADGTASPLCMATSPDGIHFTPHPPFAYLTAPYQPQPARDPVVFRDESTGLFHLLATTSLVDAPSPDRGGCLAHLVSPDLKQWEQLAPFLVPEYPGEPECPDYFFWRGWYYLIFSHEGFAHYRMSRQALGPWHKPARDMFDGPEMRVMKTAAFTGDRRMGAGFVPRARGVYAGRVIFRELIQHADGTLGTQWPAELKPVAVGP